MTEHDLNDCMTGQLNMDRFVISPERDYKIHDTINKHIWVNNKQTH